MKTNESEPIKASEENKDGKFLTFLKKVGFNVWLAVMIIGGALAFITALFLL